MHTPLSPFYGPVRKSYICTCTYDLYIILNANLLLYLTSFQWGGNIQDCVGRSYCIFPGEAEHVVLNAKLLLCSVRFLNAERKYFGTISAVVADSAGKDGKPWEILLGTSKYIVRVVIKTRAAAQASLVSLYEHF